MSIISEKKYFDPASRRRRDDTDLGFAATLHVSGEDGSVLVVAHNLQSKDPLL
jgi:hypothetical protein